MGFTFEPERAAFRCGACDAENTVEWWTLKGLPVVSCADCGRRHATAPAFEVTLLDG
jgi:Zn ribbon nucleic-acid-binding protein